MAYRIVDGVEAKQGTAAWLAFRQRGLGASDAPAVMGRSKWTTPYGLYRQKIGLDSGPKMNPAMARGIRLEPKARKAYEEFTGNLMIPMVLESQEYPILRASLDGLELAGKLVLEIKCPGKETHEFAKNGLVPECYIDQVQQQLLVSGAEELHYWSYDGEEGALVKVFPDLVRQQAIIDQSILFWQRVEAQVWASDEWAAAAAHWRAANMAFDEAKEREEEARKALISLLKDNEPKREGAGVIVTRVARKGGLDYAKILASKGIVLTPDEENAFRKKDSSTVQVREAASADELDPSALQLAPKPTATSADLSLMDDTFVLEF